ncbi:DUF1572 domain-containing protein [Winogradskyella luteola]|uniref:DUF1572 domain-containing protein n=1 Tax=Winogradskyella luteola TaxID=2828330 RepID=A0A9X1JQI3_9FLAO|nr:DUF1572 domain-containing protein [Winogradskyella luteola]MBV7267607.1 DUF1572 domain-containing protein [Winogradskyella luteola]
MKTTQLIATSLHQVYFGGNWTASNFRDNLKGVTLEIATKEVKGLNTILALSFHIHYYVKGTMDVLNGGELTIRDKFSFDYPKLQTEAEWQEFQNTMWKECKEFISLIEKLDDNALDTFLAEQKYGTYYRNLAGIIEHTHYHLGQIAIIKKFLTTA